MILLDSSVLIAAINAKDFHHQKARELLREVDAGSWGTALLPDYALCEAVAWLLRKRGPRRAHGFVVSLLLQKGVRLLRCSDQLEGILSIFLDQPGTQLSLADAALVGMARATGFRTIATFDSDFRAFRDLRVIDGPGMAT